MSGLDISVMERWSGVLVVMNLIDFVFHLLSSQESVSLASPSETNPSYACVRAEEKIGYIVVVLVADWG